MKTLATILSSTFFLITLFVTSGFSQGFTASTYVEYTKVSPKLGYMMGYTFGGEIEMEVGAFIQNEMAGPNNGTESENYIRNRERSFAGTYFNYPAINTDKFDLIIQIRTGMVNNDNFTITPSVEGRYSLLKRLNLSAGLGTRSFAPTAIGKVSWIL